MSQNTNKPLPSFNNPPLVETVLSVQFEAIPAFTNAHAGWYWKECLDDVWNKTNFVPRLNDAFERFGEQVKWGQIGNIPGLTISGVPSQNRVQIQREDNERMIQLQDSRFIYNWQKGNNLYPRFESVFPEFLKEYAKFKEFIHTNNIGEIKLNQWEVTYVNHIEKEDLWNSLSEWSNVIPEFSFLGKTENGIIPDGFGGEWRYVIGDNLGRLYININHGKVLTNSASEIIAMQITARGPISDNKESELEEGLNLGHETIVNSFASITSSNAHGKWERKQ